MLKNKLQLIYQILFLILVVLLPIQTPLLKILTEILHFPTFLNYWKEILVTILIIISCVEIILNRAKTQLIHLVPLVLLILISAYAAFQSLAVFEIPLGVFALGFRFELFWIWLFIVTYSYLKTCKPKLPLLKSKLGWGIIFGYCLLLIFVFITLKLGQNQIYTWLRFDSGNNQSVPRICDAIDYNLDTCRLSGGFGSPNHFAGYLILILPFLLQKLFLSLKTWQEIQFSRHQYFEIANNLRNTQKIIFFGFLVASNIFLIYLSYARFALLGLFVILIGSFIITKLPTSHLDLRAYIAKPKPKLNLKVINLILISTLLIPIFVGIIVINLPENLLLKLPTNLAKPSSTFFHGARTSATFDIFENSPKRLITGYGLGISGPAAKLEYYNIKDFALFRDNELIAYRHRLVGEDLTIPENWYLQLILNGGIIYALVYIYLLALAIFPLFKLIKKLGQNQNISEDSKQKSLIALGFFAILVGNLFLHLFESQIIALYWTIIYVLQDEKA